MDAPETRLVRGEILLPTGAPADAVGDVIVQVEDVSRADAPSMVVGEHRLSGVALRGQPLPFSVEVPAHLVDPRHTYSVRVHVDMTGSGTVEVGDFVSTQSHPVLTRGYGEEAQVPVKRV